MYHKGYTMQTVLSRTNSEFKEESQLRHEANDEEEQARQGAEQVDIWSLWTYKRFNKTDY